MYTTMNATTYKHSQVLVLVTGSSSTSASGSSPLRTKHTRHKPTNVT